MTVLVRAAHVIAATVLALPIASAQAQDAARVFAWREELLARLDGMALPHLQAQFLRCSKEASERMFDMAEAVPCAMAWDALLKRQFGGNVQALLVWWRVHRDDPDALPTTTDVSAAGW